MHVRAHDETHTVTLSAQPTRACTHIHSQGELVTVYTPENIYIERNERIMKSTDHIFFKYTVTDSVFISFEINPY